MTIRVVIADDQMLVRSGLAMMIDAQPDMEVVGQAGDGRAAIDLVRAARPDVVLMDIRMPGTDGLAATRSISADASLVRTKVVMLTTYDLDEYLFTALRAGAAGFLLKGVSPEELVRAVREVSAGGCLLAPSATRRLIAEFVEADPSLGADPQAQRLVSALSPRELEVLTLLSRGLSNAEIAAELIVGDNTVKTHVGHILDKLGARDRVQAVIVAFQAGAAGAPGPLRRLT